MNEHHLARQRKDVLETIGYDVRPHRLQDDRWIWVGPVVMSRLCFDSEQIAIDDAWRNVTLEVRARHGLLESAWDTLSSGAQRDLVLDLVDEEEEEVAADRMTA